MAQKISLKAKNAALRQSILNEPIPEYLIAHRRPIG
jgi:hypothetical protein